MSDQRSTPAPYDALLLLSFGGPEGPDDVVPFLENVTRGRGIPRERLKEVGQHYFLFGGVSPINDAEPRAAGRAAQGLRRARPGPAGLLGQPELGAVPDRHPARDGRRRPPPHRRPRHQRVRLVLGLPPVPREPRRRAGRPGRPRAWSCRGSTSCGTTSTTPASCDPMIDGVLASLAELPEEVRDGAHLAFTTHSIPTAAADTSGPVEDTPGGEGGAYVKPAPGRRPGDRRRGARADRRRAPLAARLPVPQRRPAHPVAGAGHLRPPGGPARRRRARRRHGAHRLRLRPHGGPVRPRHRGHRQGGRTGPARRAAPRPSAPTRGSPRPYASSCWSGPRAERGRAGRARARWARSGPSHDLCAVGCCPARAPRPAAAGADSPYA